MKKFITALLTVMMIFSLTVQAFAAGSISNGGVDGVESERGTVNSGEVNKKLYSNKTLTVVEKVNKNKKTTTVAETLGDETIRFVGSDSKETTTKFADTTKLRFLTEMKQLNFSDDANPTEDNPVNVTFTVNSMTSGMSVYVMYYCPDHNAWEMIKATKTADNQVVAPFHAGTSVYSLVYLNDDNTGNGGTNGTEGGTTDGTGTTASTETKSPKTGESSQTALLMVAGVVLAGLGLVAAGKCRKIQ